MNTNMNTYTKTLFSVALIFAYFLPHGGLTHANAADRIQMNLENQGPSAARISTFERQDAPSPESCKGLVKKLLGLHEELAKLQTSVVSITNDTASVMSSWYGQLSANYGSTVYVPYGVYDTISESSATTSQNAEIFQNEFADVLQKLANDTELLASCGGLAPQR